MTSSRLRAALVASAAFISASAAVGHAHAQWVVFDPTNYSQNVLTARGRFKRSTTKSRASRTRLGCW